jgi:Region found in RelA / SpoT proteins
MPWAVPEYDREDVNEAGNLLIADTEVVYIANVNQMLNIINNWRSSHIFPMRSFRRTLYSRANSVDHGPIIAQRLKRLSSIEAKLRRFSKMRLSQMQDIGGCRAVVKDMKALDNLVKLYKEGRSKNPSTRHEFVNEKQYVACPKDDGYRSVHLVYRYHSESKKHCVYNGLKIEIQLRTQLQHAWATAVETVALFTEQALKSGEGEERWHRFFALMSSAIALREKQPLVPNTPTNKDELKEELRRAAKELDVVDMMSGWSFALTRLPAKNVTNAVAFLIVLDTEAHTFDVQGFQEGELEQASEAYLATEKKTASNPAIQGVLVSLDSVHAIRKAYPNYYVDNRAFLRALHVATK